MSILSSSMATVLCFAMVQPEPVPAPASPPAPAAAPDPASPAPDANAPTAEVAPEGQSSALIEPSFDGSAPSTEYPPPVDVTPPPPEVQPPPPPPPAYPARPRRDPDRSSGIAFLASGLALFGSTYLSSTLIGAAVMDLDDDEAARRRAFGNRMFVPVIGPWMAVPKAGSATGAWFTGLLGVAQAAGVALTTVGAVRLGRANRRRLEQVSVGGTYLPGGGNITFGMRF